MIRIVAVGGILAAITFAFVKAREPVELGKVKWGRDLEAALSASQENGKPVFALFQEVPGCAGCQQFGKEVLSHPQLIEVIETEFVPVAIFNNQPGKDAEILKQFGEPAWNYQVVRFLDGAAQDIIPRKDRVWTLEGIASRMIAALEAANREVPNYLRALSGTAGIHNEGVAAFAMHCFWTGEQRLGGLDGVFTTEAGWLAGREVTLVRYDRDEVSLAELAKAAIQFTGADQAFVGNGEDGVVAGKAGLKVSPLTEDYRVARASDQKRQLRGTVFQKLNLSPIQATKVNAFARTETNAAVAWLSPAQIKTLTSP
ncbi:MAG: VPGUxxT family thioredoxin-like (seleno)protein, type 2 [Verrucomicrobiota bacterium]